jgi:hypothetical protein
VLSAWLLAVHPWFLRYASEARGYSVLLLMVPVILLVWLRATRENRWRWWLAFGASQFSDLVGQSRGGIHPRRPERLHRFVACRRMEASARGHKISTLAGGNFDSRNTGEPTDAAAGPAVSQLFADRARGAAATQAMLAHGHIVEFACWRWLE